jgi:hypothetical protein
MVTFPIWPSKESRRRRYRCLGCKLLIGIDQDECDHCGRAVSEPDRNQMKENFRAKTRAGLPGLIIVLAFVLLLIFVIRSSI